MQLQCPGCSKPLKVPDELAGKNVKCPACQTVIAVPAPQSGDDLTIEGVTTPPVPGTSGPKKPQQLSKKRFGAKRAGGKKELAEFQKQRAHGRSEPQAQADVPDEAGACPNCGGGMPPATVVCPSCGYDLLGGAGKSSREPVLARVKG
ncbi:MAG TPA: hypothetical protein ENN09_07340, partial [Planctomycetes bacterium]|nr:hypothetical protein [Planctomycetota bacterium]